jgi:cytochrome c oxidase subunit II
MKKVLSLLILLVLTATLSMAAGAEMGNCPVTGEKIDPKTAVTYEHKGNTYTFCCAGCIEPFKKDPEKYIAIVPPLSGKIKDGVREITVIAKKYEFLPDPIGVKEGEKVRLIVSTPDVTHGIGIKEYKINRTVQKGKDEVIEFTADKAGVFTVSCTVYCGNGHGQMKGKLMVVPAATQPKAPASDTHQHHNH